MLKLYNTLSHKKETFKPLKPKNVGLYTCGPTVYNYAHIGNLRTYIFEDILRRTLKYNSFKVKQVMNITDVEDKIIKKAKEEGKDIYSITKPYEKLFHKDLKRLNIEKAEYYPKATDNIKEIIELAKKLLKKGFAYISEDKSVYFNISKFKNYGRLSGLKKRELKIGARIAIDEYNKNEARDFVLWKSEKSGEPSWPSPWSNGRPGWHIECSAMSIKYLGETFDIHAGAVDLIFPHHENEIAQSEAATGKKFVNYWIEGEHILVNNQKMSKSSGNFYTLQDIADKGFDPLAFRYLTLTSHYRSKLNFTMESLKAAENALHNLQNFLSSKKENEKMTADKKIIDKFGKEFLSAVNDDLNIPKALAIVWKTVKNKNLPFSSKKRLILGFDKILGLNLKAVKTAKIPAKIEKMAAQREKLRGNKQFVQADTLRKEIEKLGYVIEDTAYGTQITSARH